MASRPDTHEILESDALLERLAAIEHERWAHWQRYMHEQCAPTAEGALVIPPELVRRWSTQSATPYEELSDIEKASDREQVWRYLPLIIEAVNGRDVRP